MMHLKETWLSQIVTCVYSGFQVAVLVECGAIPPFCKLLDCMDTQVNDVCFKFSPYVYVTCYEEKLSMQVCSSCFYT